MVANINPSIPNQMVPKGVVTQEFFSEAIQRTLWQAMSSVLSVLYQNLLLNACHLWF